MSSKLTTFICDSSREYYAKYSMDLQLHRNLNLDVVEDGVILPAIEIPCGNDVAYLGGVLNKQGNFLNQSATIRDKQAKSLLDGYNPGEVVEIRKETVIYGGILYEFYGHVLLETLSRLWYLFKNTRQKYRVVFDVVPRARNKFTEFFELLDIPYDAQTFIDHPIRYSTVIIPEQASIYAASWHEDWLLPYDYMASKVEKEHYEKIYFTRTKLVERNPVWGEAPIESLFEKNGYAVFSPERLSLRNQIALMKGCKVLATISSSTYHNLLFAANNVKMISLNRAFETDFSQHIVNQAKDNDEIYVDVSLNPLPVSHVSGPWIVGLTEELRDFFVSEGMFFEGRTNTVTKMDLNRFYLSWYKRYGNSKISRDVLRNMQERIFAVI